MEFLFQLLLSELDIMEREEADTKNPRNRLELLFQLLLSRLEYGEKKKLKQKLHEISSNRPINHKRHMFSTLLTDI